MPEPVLPEIGSLPDTGALADGGSAADLSSLLPQIALVMVSMIVKLVLASTDTEISKVRGNHGCSCDRENVWETNVEVESPARLLELYYL